MARMATVPLSSVCDVISGPAFPSREFGDVGLGTRLLRGENIEPGRLRWTKTRTWPDRLLDGYQHLLVRPGDLILGMDRPVVSAGLKLAAVSSDDCPALLVQRVARIRPYSIDGGYLRLWLDGEEFRRHLNLSSTGTQLPHVTLRSIKDFRVPRFGEFEERRIVEILEDHLSRLDAARSDLVRTRDISLPALRMASLRSACATPGRPQALGELSTVRTGSTPLRSNRAYHERGTVPWVTSGDLSQGLITEATSFVTDAAVQERKLRVFPAGTLLVAMYGEGKTRGRCGELGIPATINQACAAIELHDPGLKEWVRLALDSQYEQMRALASGGVQPNLNLSLVRSVEINFPAPRVRAAAMSQVRATEQARREMEGAVERQLLRADRLRHVLLAAAFSGRLTGHASDLDRAEELASVTG